MFRPFSSLSEGPKNKAKMKSSPSTTTTASAAGGRKSAVVVVARAGSVGAGRRTATTTGGRARVQRSRAAGGGASSLSLSRNNNSTAAVVTAGALASGSQESAQDNMGNKETQKAQVGLIGLAVMGQNLALNVASKGFPISVYNRSYNKTEQCVSRATKEKLGDELTGYDDLGAFVQSLERPRNVILLVKAGAPVDATIESLLGYLEPGDAIIDGGNEWYQNTEARQKKVLEDEGILYMGMGVSGGEEGARNGPSMMPGGNKDVWDRVQPILSKVAAQVDDGPCVTYIGKGGAGNFVKMVHNGKSRAQSPRPPPKTKGGGDDSRGGSHGSPLRPPSHPLTPLSLLSPSPLSPLPPAPPGIEYGDMQLIAEAYDVLRTLGGLTNDELEKCFADWNQGELESFLIETSATIFAKKDDQLPEGTNEYLVDKILDKTGMKGTGKWTVQQVSLPPSPPRSHALSLSRVGC